jgi:hypothetical protein
MRISAKYLFVASFAMFALTFIGCSGSGTVNNPPGPTTDSSKLVFTQGSSANYQRSTLDSMPGEPVVMGSEITFTQVLVDTSFVKLPYSKVQRYDNTYSTGAPDSSFLWQSSNDEIYAYNFGIDFLNNNVAVSAVIGKVNIRWVLQAKMKAALGTKWSAVDTTIMLPLPSFNNPALHLQDTAVVMADTTILVGTEQIKTRHFQHTVTGTTAVGGASDVVDTYVSAALGATVLNRVHPSNVDAQHLVANKHSQGSVTIMTSHK